METKTVINYEGLIEKAEKYLEANKRELAGRECLLEPLSKDHPNYRHIDLSIQVLQREIEAREMFLDIYKSRKKEDEENEARLTAIATVHSPTLVERARKELVANKSMEKQRRAFLLAAINDFHTIKDQRYLNQLYLMLKKDMEGIVRVF